VNRGGEPAKIALGLQVDSARKRHLSALGHLFAQALALCQAAGMVRLGRVALDGTKVRANASKRKAMS
jgi:hypothetical protein